MYKNLKVWNDSCRYDSEEVAKETTYLKLDQRNVNSPVFLCCCDRDGITTLGGNICFISNKDRNLVRPRYISIENTFKLNKRKQIKISK